jgi:hypothetical protein
MNVVACVQKIRVGQNRKTCKANNNGRRSDKKYRAFI